MTAPNRSCANALANDGYAENRAGVGWVVATVLEDQTPKHAPQQPASMARRFTTLLIIRTTPEGTSYSADQLAPILAALLCAVFMMSRSHGLVVWLTGLPASGKSTLANALQKRLLDASIPACIIDGDVLRSGLCSDLGFSEEDRKENVRRAGEMAKFLAAQGLVAIVALVSPYARDRQQVRAGIPDGQFFQVHVDCPVDVCRQRDPKGLYRRADRGEIKDFTGVSAPYEAPPVPELHIQTAAESVEESSARLLEAVLTRVA